MAATFFVALLLIGNSFVLGMFAAVVMIRGGKILISHRDSGERVHGPHRARNHGRCK